MKVLLPKSTEVDVIMRLDKFVALRDYFTNGMHLSPSLFLWRVQHGVLTYSQLENFVFHLNPDEIGPIFVEKGMAQQFMDALLEAADLDTLGCLLFTISDLLDIDNSGTFF